MNAKYHEREAEIVAQAGRFGAVTIATNMAGRGTDIILGGVPDHRARALLVSKEVDLEQASLEEREAAAAQVQAEMAGEFRRELQQRKLPAEERHTLARRYLGLMASFAPDHPSVAGACARWPPRARRSPRTSTPRATSPAPPRRRSRKSFYPEIENPVDFLAVHPLRASLETLAATPEFADVAAAARLQRARAGGGARRLHILGTERHEARRIDNQLRGRAGRQGDPGSSRFYLSLEDDLMRIFGSERISGLMLRLGMEEGVPIEHGMVTRSIERAQKQVEAQNFAIRKHLLEYDDVMNKQREAVYDMRRMILEGKDTREHVMGLLDEIVDWYVDSYCAEKDSPSTGAYEGLRGARSETFGVGTAASELRTLGRDEMVRRARPGARAPATRRGSAASASS